MLTADDVLDMVAGWVGGLLWIVGAVVVVTGLASLAYQLDAWSCRGKWADSKREVSYTWAGGCRVQVRSGQWLPAEVVREVDL